MTKFYPVLLLLALSSGCSSPRTENDSASADSAALAAAQIADPLVSNYLQAFPSMGAFTVCCGELVPGQAELDREDVNVKAFAPKELVSSGLPIMAIGKMLVESHYLLAFQHRSSTNDAYELVFQSVALEGPVVDELRLGADKALKANNLNHRTAQLMADGSLVGIDSLFIEEKLKRVSTSTYTLDAEGRFAHQFENQDF